MTAEQELIELIAQELSKFNKHFWTIEDYRSQAKNVFTLSKEFLHGLAKEAGYKSPEEIHEIIINLTVEWEATRKEMYKNYVKLAKDQSLPETIFLYYPRDLFEAAKLRTQQLLKLGWQKVEVKTEQELEEKITELVWLVVDQARRNPGIDIVQQDLISQAKIIVQTVSEGLVEK